jgi:hypothetical protein
MSISPESEEVRHAVARIHSGVISLVFAMIGGLGLFLMTVWLLIRGGEAVGLHLNLLGNYFPGYSVTWVGSLLGFVYGAIVGAIIGWAIGKIYNLVVRLRHH